jgi:hypothetical protein
MAKLKNITAYINTTLEANVFNTSRFQGGRFYTIAELVPEIINDTRTAKPCVVDNDGECVPVIVDDTYPLQVYHRIMSLANTPADPDMYGDGLTYTKLTATMSLVFISDRSRVQMRGEDLTTIIAANIPPTLPQTQLNALSLYSVAIYPQGEVQIDSEIVYNREYRLTEYLLKPNSIMHSISYVVEVVYSKDCLKACDV